MTETPNEPDDTGLEQSENLDQRQPEDTLVDRGVDDVLDEGYSPPEKWSAAEGYGNTPLEEERGETIEQRMKQEVPEEDPYAAAGNNPEHVGGEVGSERAGRLVAEDEGTAPDEEKDLVADDIGIDGAGASAEEAAVHVVEDE